RGGGSPPARRGPSPRGWKRARGGEAPPSHPTARSRGCPRRGGDVPFEPCAEGHRRSRSRRAGPGTRGHGGRARRDEKGRVDRPARGDDPLRPPPARDDAGGLGGGGAPPLAAAGGGVEARDGSRGRGFPLVTR